MLVMMSQARSARAALSRMTLAPTSYTVSASSTLAPMPAHRTQSPPCRAAGRGIKSTQNVTASFQLRLQLAPCCRRSAPQSVWKQVVADFARRKVCTHFLLTIAQQHHHPDQARCRT